MALDDYGFAFEYRGHWGTPLTPVCLILDQKFNENSESEFRGIKIQDTQSVF